MKKNISIFILMIFVIMLIPIQLFAISTSTSLKATDIHGLIFRATAPASITLNFIGSQIKIDRMNSDLTVSQVNVSSSSWNITLSSGEAFAIQNIINGSVTVSYNDQYVNMQIGNIRTFAEQYAQSTTPSNEYQIWNGFSYTAPVKLVDYPYQCIGVTNGLQTIFVSKSPIRQSMNLYQGKTYYESVTSLYCYTKKSNMEGFDGPYNTTSQAMILAEINHDLYKVDNTTFIQYANAPVPPPSVPTGSTGTVIEANNVTVNIVSPQDGFEDNVNLFSFLATYKIPLNTYSDKTKISLEVVGGVKGTGEVLSHDIRSSGGYWDGMLRFDRLLNPGSNTITLNIKYNGQIIGHDVVQLTYFDDFVDSNSDGLDDRTGQTEYNPYVPLEDEKPDRSMYEDGIVGDVKYGFATIVYYLNVPLGIVGDLVLGLTTSVGYLTSQVGNLATVFGAFFTWLPLYCSVPLGLGVTAAVILKIFGR